MPLRITFGVNTWINQPIFTSRSPVPACSFRTLREEELAWYTAEALNHFGSKRLPTRKDDQLIQQMLGKSPNDQESKRTDKTYYIANVIAYLRVVNELLSGDFIDSFNGSTNVDDLVIYNYHRVFRDLLFDSLILLKYSTNIEKTPARYQCGKNSWQHSLTLYQSLRQAIFGQASFHSFVEIEPDLSISLIRQLVELRVRRAFGILGWYDSTTDSFEPLPISRLFETIARYRKNIDFSVPIDCLIRIYGWSNVFLHTGIKDYSWKHILVKDYLKTFSIGKEGGFNVNDGISMPKGVLTAIVSELEATHPKNARLITFQSEARLSGA